MTEETRLKDYQELKKNILLDYNHYLQFEEEPCNYIALGRYMELIDRFCSARIDITNKKIERSAFEDMDGNEFGFDIISEEYDVIVGVRNEQSFDDDYSDTTTDILASTRLGLNEYNNYRNEIAYIRLCNQDDESIEVSLTTDEDMEEVYTLIRKLLTQEISYNEVKRTIENLKNKRN